MRRRIAAALLALAASGCDDAAPAPAQRAPLPPAPAKMGPEVGDVAPPIDLKDERGARVRSAAWVGRRAALLIFGTTMCPVCQKEIKTADEVLKRFPDRVEVAAVLLSASEESAREYREKHAPTFTLLVDPGNATMRPFDITLGKNYPWYVLVDRAGVIRYSGGKMPGDGELEAAAK